MNEILEEKIKTLADVLRALADFAEKFMDDVTRLIDAAIHTAVSVKKYERKPIYAIGRPQRGYPRSIRATARSFLS